MYILGVRKQRENKVTTLPLALNAGQNVLKEEITHFSLIIIPSLNKDNANCMKLYLSNELSLQYIE